MKTKRLAITSNFIIFFLQIIFLSSIKAEIPIFELSSKIIKYENNNSLIIAEGDAHAKHSSGKEIFSKKIIYNKKNSLIETFSQSTYKDNLGNTIEADSFYYDLNKKIIKAKKT